MSDADLTEKQRRFVEEYLVDLNARQAAIRAGYSKKGADNAGWRLLRNPKVQDFLEEARERRVRSTQTSARWVIEELVSLYEETRRLGKHTCAKGCLDLIGKHHSAWNERVFHLANEEPSRSMSPSELDARTIELNREMIRLLYNNPDIADQQEELIRQSRQLGRTASGEDATESDAVQ